MKKEFTRSSWFCLGVSALLALPLCTGLMGTYLINGHDSMAGLIRAMSMERYMGQGQFLVRWAPEINGGFGYPMFNFYPPFFSFVSVLIFQAVHNMVLAVNLACILFWLLSAIGMFLLSREFWGDEGGVLSAVLYAYAPYHIVDIYVRGAFAEFSSFALFPYFMLFILKMSRKPSLGYVLLGAASVFTLSLTHNIMSMLFFPIAVFYMLYIFFTEKKSAWVLCTAGVFVIGLMMSSFFWLPALLEKKFLNLGFLISMRYDFHKSFISLSELFWPLNKGVMDNVTFQVGVIHSLLCLAALACLPKIFKINRQAGLGFIFFLIIGLIAVFFTLPCSHLFWEHISILRFIQFPWRLLTIIAFAMSFLGGSAGLLIKDRLTRRGVLAVIGILVIVISLKSSPKPAFVIDLKSIEQFVALGEGEYTPKWVIIPPTKIPERKFEIVRGHGQLGEEKSLNPVSYETQYNASGPSLLSFNTFYFPGWQVYVDGRTVNPYINNPFGLILFLVKQPGSHDIHVVFGSTPVRITAMVISWLGLVLLLGGVLWAKTGSLQHAAVLIILAYFSVTGLVPAGYAQTDEVGKYISYLKSPDADIRMGAAEALGAIKDLRSVGPLITVLNDKDKGVRRSAARTLGFIRDPEAVEPLIAVLKDPDPTVQKTVIEALASIKDSRAVEPLMAFIKDKDPVVREDVVTFLGKMKDIRAYDSLEAALKDPDMNVKKAAEKALGAGGKEPGETKPVEAPKPAEVTSSTTVPITPTPPSEPEKALGSGKQ